MASSLAFFAASSSSSLALGGSRAFSDHLARPPCPSSLGTPRAHPLDCKFPQLSIGCWRVRNIVHASTNGTNAVDVASMSDDNADYVPMPVVLIDQNSDSDATIVQLSFGDRLGALIDTMRALKDLGLDVSKGIVTTEGAVKQTKFYITRLDTGRKVDDPELLERIRLTIINNLLEYHPESSAQLALGEAFGIQAPEKKLDVDIATRIQVKEDGPKRRGWWLKINFT
ncbi:hypothetical protein BT93_J0058 [Corymbia citriodora subsp. variegata]|nr:hypothetical protein BT93_J0058 [Corymbia citriodora subsp. variegata]